MQERDGRPVFRDLRWGVYVVMLNISVLSAALLGNPTGSTREFRGDVVATAKRDLAEGEKLDGEGGYTVYRKLLPARTSLGMAGLLIGLSQGVTLKRPVARGETVSWSDVNIEQQSETLRARREMENRQRSLLS